MLIYCQLDSEEQTSTKLLSGTIIFFQENTLENAVQNGGHFAKALLC